MSLGKVMPTGKACMPEEWDRMMIVIRKYAKKESTLTPEEQEKRRRDIIEQNPVML